MTELDRILDKIIRKCPAGSLSILSLREAAEITCGIVEDETAALRAEVEALKRTATEAGKAIGNLSQLNTELREVLEDARAAMAAHDYYYGEGCRARFTDEIAQATAALAQTQEVTE
jgi:hypothetical protein